MPAILPTGAELLGDGVLDDPHSRMHGRNLLQWENVRAHGAVGDGIADDYDAIWSAIQASGESNLTGKRRTAVFFPYGTYNISQTIDISGLQGVYLVGASDNFYYNSFCRIVGTGLPAIIRADRMHALPDYNTEDADASIELYLRNLSFNESTVPLDVTEYAILRASHCNFFGDGDTSDSYAIALRNHFWAWFQHCRFEVQPQPRHTVLLDSPQVVNRPPGLTHFEDVIFQGGGVVLKAHDHTTPSSGVVDNITFTRCVTEGTNTSFLELQNTNSAADTTMYAQQILMVDCNMADSAGAPPMLTVGAKFGVTSAQFIACQPGPSYFVKNTSPGDVVNVSGMNGGQYGAAKLVDPAGTGKVMNFNEAGGALTLTSDPFMEDPTYAQGSFRTSLATASDQFYFLQTAEGRKFWGPGDNTFDVQMWRPSANQLAIGGNSPTNVAKAHFNTNSGDLILRGHIGVGEAPSAVEVLATTEQACIRKVRIYDSNNLLMGYIPIYADLEELDPTTISGLVAWYDFSDVSTLWQDTGRSVAITTDGQMIKGVTDKSGATNHLSETTAGPTYQTQVVGGAFSAAQYTGAEQLSHADAASLSLTSGSIFVVAQTTQTLYNRGLVEQGVPAVSTGYGLQVQCAGGLEAASVVISVVSSSLEYANTTPAYPDVHDGAPHVYTATFNATDLAVKVDDGHTGTFSGTVHVSDSPNPFYVGGTIADGSWIGEIAEVLVYNSVLSAPDQESVENYIGYKYGCPI